MGIGQEYLTRMARLYREAEQENAARDAAKRQPMVDAILKGATVWYTIKTLDGRTLSRTHGVGGSKWLWIVETVADDAECEPEDVDTIETEDGDIITVRGEHYARVTSSSGGV